MQIPEPKEGRTSLSYRIDKDNNRYATGAPLLTNFVWVVGKLELSLHTRAGNAR